VCAYFFFLLLLCCGAGMGVGIIDAYSQKEKIIEIEGNYTFPLFC
jgi:hypothetical protein